MDAPHEEGVDILLGIEIFEAVIGDQVDHQVLDEIFRVIEIDVLRVGDGCADHSVLAFFEQDFVLRFSIVFLGCFDQSACGRHDAKHIKSGPGFEQDSLSGIRRPASISDTVSGRRPCLPVSFHNIKTKKK